MLFAKVIVGILRRNSPLRIQLQPRFQYGNLRFGIFYLIIHNHFYRSVQRYFFYIQKFTGIQLLL